MRLGNVVDEKSSSRDGQGDKQGMGRNNKGRRSSLDFKVSSYHSNGSPITTKPGKRKNRQHQQQQQYEEEQMKQQQQQTRRPYLSRARGHSGPPPRKWELADLKNMNEEELLQALYADPELAQEAARMAEKIAAEKGSPPSAVPTGTPSRQPTTTPRSKRGSAAGRNGPGDYPDHMRELMDGGVPVIQWVIVLVLLGAAFYQLRKIVSLPETNHKDVSKRRSRGKGEPKKNKGSSNLASLDKVALAIDVDIHALEDVKSSSKASTNKKAATAPTKKQQKVKKEKGNVKNNLDASKAINKKQEEDTDDDSVGSDDAVLPVPAAPVKVAPTTRVPVSAPLPTLSAGMTNKDDGNGWQVVSKTTRGGITEATTVSVEAKSSSPTEPTTSPPVVDSKENIPPPATTAALNGKNDPSGKTTKKKQKKGKVKGVDNSNNNSNPSSAAAASAKNGMEDDAALAQELQREEDNIANKTTSDSDNTWEEVAIRKRKGNTKPDAATN